MDSKTSMQRRVGFDVVRLVAMGLVALQHVLSISGIDPPAILGVLNIGQLGVACFCSLSGYLAAQGHEPPLSWLSRRLVRLFVPYWLVVSALFLANTWSPYKSVSLGLIVSEYLGMAYLSHGGAIVGTHLWFISLIIICYIMGALFRQDARMFPILLVFDLALLRVEPWLAAHGLAFLLGMWLARSTYPRLLACGFALLCALGWGIESEWLAYPAAGILALAGSLSLPGASPGWVAAASLLTYEFYLVHGPIYLALRVRWGLGVLGVATIGTVLGLVATWLVHRVSRAILAVGNQRSARRELATREA
jgi:peptidoglycan/LPS O-acetylase OafA/YrhL